MAECCSRDYDLQFDDERARRDLLEYRARGPGGGTRRLIDALLDQGISGASLLDIGGGIGAIQLELLAAGAARSLDVDASGPYLATAREVAEQRGLADRTAYLHGDFVELADTVAGADVVTLDRVICCYPELEALLGASLARAGRLYGLVYPRDAWWVRSMLWLENLGATVFRRGFRVWAHRQLTIDRLTAEAGMELVFAHTGLVWRTALWRRREHAA